MNLGEINKGAIVLILVLLLGGGGYLWWSQMYKPAVAERADAKAASDQATAALTQAKTELAAAQQRVEDAKKESAKPDESLSTLAISLAAVPRKKLIDDAAIVLKDMAGQSGINTSFEASDEADNASASTAPSSGATPIDLEFEATGTYSEMMQFMSLVEGNVQARDGKLYARGRLFNVVKLEIGSEGEETDNAESGFSSGADGGGSSSKPALGKNEIAFKVVVRMYTSSTDSAESLGASTPDPAAAATTPGAEGTDTGGAAAGTSTDATAGGATTPTDGSAGGATDATGAASTGTDTGAAATDTTSTAGAPA